MRALLAASLVLVTVGRALAAEPSSCESCHAASDQVGAEWARITEDHAKSVHAELGFDCHDCHGGNPDPRLSRDAAAAMDPDFGPNPFVGAPARRDVPGFCGRCHSDPVLMRRFDPGARIDQEREYWTSRHGLALARGDPHVATCIDCHGSHGALRVDDLASPVFPTHVAETCSHCHASPETMAGYETDAGRPLPVDQYALWRQSVHAAALLEREDLSAPTCNDCHGNHGATPPDVQSISQVCGQCHHREAQLFRQSPKSEGFRVHEEMLASVGKEGCPACHVAPDPQARLEGLTSLGECTACHGNHGIVRPTVAMLAPLPKVPCAFCHEARVPGEPALIADEAAAEHYRATRDGLVAAADAQELYGTARFDWLVDQARTLPFHTLPPLADGGARRLRPEFERLFGKFRIGKTRFTYRDPRTGELASATVKRCTTCHAAEPTLADAPRGLQMAKELLERMSQLTAVTATAERTMLRARRGGVETAAALSQIDASVDAQVDLEVLVHAFDLGPDSEFVRKHAAGTEHANAALAFARAAVGELAARRRGLVAFLAVVALVLVGLGMKIRQVSARERGQPEQPVR